MTTMIAELYDALIAAGSPEDKARKAAETVAANDNRFATVDVRLVKLESDLNIVKWMLGYVITVLTGIFIKLLLK